MKTIQQSLYRVVLVAAAMVLMAASAQRLLADGLNNFTQTNLVSDIPGLAATTDPSLVNPWGVSFAPTSPFWVSDNGTGLSTLYNGAGVKQGLVVTVAPGGAAPTGQVFNPNPGNFGGALFIFATEGGTIASWKGGTVAAQNYNSPLAAVYKGLAMGSNSQGTFLFATDFHNGAITVLNSNFSPTSLSGSFTDPGLPAGYAPFNIQNIGGKLYVTYALQDAAKHDDISGAGNGFVDVFDTNGNFIQRLISHGSLNSPWGMAIAPAGFGNFGTDLLVGNFGDGTINAFNPLTGSLIGQLEAANGKPIVNLGLWDLTFGNGGSGGSVSDLYFTAGIPGPGQVEDHGLFGSLTPAPEPTPEPATLTLIGCGLLGLIAYRRRRTVTVA